MAGSTLRVQRDGAVATLIMERAAAANALDHALRAALAAALREAGADAAIRAIVLAGAGRVFCAGADLKEPPAQDMEAHIRDEYRPIYASIVSCPKPIIAAVGGTAAGAGLALALACDLLVLADDAALHLPFANIGLVTDCGSSWQLAHRLGYARAYELAIESGRISAQRALEWGLVNRLEPRERVLDVAMDWARSLAARSPLALAATKQAMRYALEHGYLETFDLEARLQARCTASADHREGVRAFLEKRRPDFRGS